VWHLGLKVLGMLNLFIKFEFKFEFVSLHTLMSSLIRQYMGGWECELMDGNIASQHWSSRVGLHHHCSCIGRVETVHLLKHGQVLKLSDQRVYCVI